MARAPGEGEAGRAVGTGEYGGKPAFAHLAELLGDPGRARMIECLLDGRPHSAGELARAAGLSAQAASMQLRKLLASTVVHVERDGRHRYYRLSGPRMAGAIEALGSLGADDCGARVVDVDPALRSARTCYDHLAGRWGVNVLDALVRREYLLDESGALRLSSPGARWVEEFGVDLNSLRRSRRPLILVCQDWTERRPHLAGALGAALLERMLALRWLVRLPGTRAVRVTMSGRTDLLRRLGIVA